MKKVIFLVVAIATVIVSSACGKKEDIIPSPPPTWEEILVGKWKIVKVGLNANRDEVERVENCVFWEFLADKTGKELGYSTQNSRECTPDDHFKTDEVSFTWKIENRDFIYVHERLGEVKMNIIQSPDKKHFKVTRSRKKSEDWELNVVRIEYYFTRI